MRVLTLFLLGALEKHHLSGCPIPKSMWRQLGRQTAWGVLFLSTSLGQEDPLEKGMAMYSSILAGEIHGQRSLAGYSPWGHKESDTTEQLNNRARTHTIIRLICFRDLYIR